jgi:flagellar motility protein MotE (MotC chaperone)
MRKLIILCEIAIVVFFAIKFLALGGIIKKVESPTGISALAIGQALAEPAVNILRGGPVQDIDEVLAQEKKLLAGLTERQQQLENRENALKTEEKRLDALKREIIEKMERLRELEEKLKGGLDAVSSEDEKKYKDLAKAYEAAPPNQVGAILEKMDIKTAAAILMSMNTKKAGPIWGHLSPAKSAELAKEITQSKLAGTK